MTLPDSFAVALDPLARRASDRVALRAAPGAVVHVTPAGASALDVLLAGGPVGDASRKAGTDVTPLVRVLLDAGIVHPRPVGGTWTARDVTVVIPARDAASSIGALVGAVAPLPVVVTDDGSADGTAAIARAAGATVCRHERALGPAAARNTGMAAVATELVAFLDADCRPAPGWLEPLLPHFDDPAVGAVAPRIVATPGAGGGSLVSRYERERSPLDQGPSEAGVGPGAASALVPTAALVVRRRALDGIGGFDPTLRFGEDQDVVYRLADAGWRLRYEPAGHVAHDHRSTVRGWLRRRAGYGTPAGVLARRHGRRVAALPLPAPAGLARLPRDLARIGVPTDEAAAAVRRTLVRAARTAAHAPTRTWLPIAAAASLRWRAARYGLAILLVTRHVGDWRARRPPFDPATWFALRVADEAALATGTWWGAARARNLTPLLPALDGRPRCAAGDGTLVAEVLWLP